MIQFGNVSFEVALVAVSAYLHTDSNPIECTFCFHGCTPINGTSYDFNYLFDLPYTKDI